MVALEYLVFQSILAGETIGHTWFQVQKSWEECFEKTIED